MNKRQRKKCNKKEILKIMKKLDISKEDVIQIDKNGCARIDFENEIHLKIYERWISD